MNLQGASQSADESNLIALSSEVDHLFQVVAGISQEIVKPEGAGTLWMHADTGDWRVRPGHYEGIVTLTADPASDRLIGVAPPIGDFYSTGDGPVWVSSVGGLVPAGLSLHTDYWVVSGLDHGTPSSNLAISLAASFEDALAFQLVDITGVGTGTIWVGAPTPDGWAEGRDPTVQRDAQMGAKLLPEGELFSMAAPGKCAFVAFNANDVLTYWWT